MADTPGEQDLKFDTENLYRIDMYTDQRSGSIRRMVPVDGDGNTDSSRDVRFVGEATAMTPAGTLPLSFELPGSTLDEAAAGFAEGAQKAMAETVEELKRMQREHQNSIYVPGQGQQGGGGMPPGGGQIKF